MPAVSRSGTVPKTPLRPVTRENPCPVCSGDHKCSVGDDGDFIICGRKADEEAIREATPILGVDT